mgnify:FL=1
MLVSNLKKWVFDNKLDVLMWVFAAVFIYSALKPLLADNITAGWDTVPHFYLLTKMAGFLKDWNISGYDSLWLGGYPAFTFYGPFPYVLMAAFYYLFFGAIKLTLVFNLFLFILPFFFLFCLYYSSRVWLSQKAGYLSLVFGIIFLTASKYKGHLGLGLHGEILVGLFSAMLAMSLMVLMIGFLKKYLDTKHNKYLVCGAVVLGIIILTHALITLFSGILLLIFTLTYFRKFWKQSFAVFFGGIVLSSFWLIPFLKNLDLSSGQKMGIANMPTTDPLLALYPNLDLISTKLITLSMFPGILLLITTIVGLVKLAKTKVAFLSYAFIFTLVVLPREYLITFLDLPIHYYRFMAPVFILGLFVATAGTIYIFEYFEKFRVVPKQILRGLFISFIVVTLITSAVDYLNWRQDSSIYIHEFNLKNYPESVSAKQMLEFIGNLPVKGRVTAYTTPYLHDQLGTPHYFSTFLPLNYGISVFPGLLAESALSTQYILPVLTRIGNSFNWGETLLLFDPGFYGQDMSSMIKRLELFGVEYILINKEAKDTLFAGPNNNNLTAIKEIGGFLLLKLAEFKPIVEATTYKPFLFVDEGGMDFSTFSKAWFKSVKLFDHPVIYTPKKWDEISLKDKDSIGGLIVSYANLKALSLEEYNGWKTYGKKLIFLNAYPNFAFEASAYPDVRFVDSFNVSSSLDEFEYTLTDISPAYIKQNEVDLIVKEDEYLKFASYSGTLINYSYFPRWKSLDEDQTVFWATPSMMFIFGRGEVEMRY